MKRYRRAFTWLCIAGLAMVAAGLVREMRTVRQDDDLFGRLVAITNEPEDKVRSNRILPGDIPVLLRWLRADSSASTKLRKLLNWVFERNSSETLEGEILSNPANWAVLGFEALGERGAKAADELGMLARTEKGKGAAREALLFIGEPAWDEVIELVGSPEFENRLFVARYLGIVGRRPKESQKILVKLAEDPEAEVRKAALRALAEFPGSVAEKTFIQMLSDLNNEESFKAAAFGLRNGSLDALRALVDARDRTTNSSARSAVMAAMMMRDVESIQPQTIRERRVFYNWAENNYYAAMNPRTEYWMHLREEQVWVRVRANVLAAREPNFAGEYEREKNEFIRKEGKLTP